MVYGQVRISSIAFVQIQILWPSLLDNVISLEIPTAYYTLSDHSLPITDVVCGVGPFPRCRMLTSSADNSCKVRCLTFCGHGHQHLDFLRSFLTLLRDQLYQRFNFPTPLLLSQWIRLNGCFLPRPQMATFTRSTYFASEWTSSVNVVKYPKRLVVAGKVVQK